MRFKSGDKVKANKELIVIKSGVVRNTYQNAMTGDEFIALEGSSFTFNALDFDLDTEADSAPAAMTASKNDKNKVDLSLIPYVAQRAEALAFMVGEKKYGRYNYAKGHKASQLVAAAMRHLNAWFEGEENDPTDGQPHLGSVRACVSMIMRQAELGTLKDDRFKLPSGSEV